MRTSEQISELVTALVAAQKAMKNPEKNRTAKIGTYSYAYADLPTVIECARYALATNGLAHVATIERNDDKLALVMRLMHTSGQWIESEYRLPLNVDDKALAASITYGRRYLFTSLLGIAADDDTDDQPQAGAQYPQRQAKQAAPTQAQVTPRPAAQAVQHPSTPNQLIASVAKPAIQPTPDVDFKARFGSGPKMPAPSPYPPLTQDDEDRFL